MVLPSPAASPSRARPPFTVRLFGAVLAGKVAGAASRVLGRGGGTSFPGVAARRVDTAVLREIVARSDVRPVLVTGSNGKTTTVRFTAAALRGEGVGVTTNTAGANLVQGVTTLAVAAADLRGRLRPGVLLAEVDEGALPIVAPEVSPAAVLVTDLFRDQLDRFGELYAVAGAIERVGLALPPDAAWIVNADDPLVASLASERVGRRVTFGLDLAESTDSLTRAADTIRCPRCRSNLEYRAVFLSHMGDYRCPACGFARPPLDVAVDSVQIEGIERTTMRMRTPSGPLELSIPQAGIHIAYDAAAAIAILVGLGVDTTRAAGSLATISPAFGRLERIDAGGRRLVLAFVKNPTSYNTTLRALAGEGEPRQALLAASNTLVDGEDFGWLWDVDFESVASRLERATVSGTRADEIANRLKYAGVDPARIEILDDLDVALEVALGGLPPEGRLVVLAGYTPTIQLRGTMQRRGWVGPYWEV